MPSEDVIELSVEETNKLRAELGLKPLRIEGKSSEPVTAPSGDKTGEEEALELSVEETNKLREKLGLAPLRTNTNKEVHKPAENTGEKEESLQRIQQAKLRRQVEDGAARVFGTSTLGLNDQSDVNKKDDEEALSWAERMRKQKTTSAKKSKKKKGVQPKDQKLDYGETDLEGMQVRNNMTGLEAGEEAVLTLADAPILETKTFVSNKVVGLNEEEDALENVGLTEQEKQRDGLRKKRMLEMGMGRAGGYAGFDDDEFEELGGTLGPSNQERGGGIGKEKSSNIEGFRIGSQQAASMDASKTDFDRIQDGQAISLFWKGDTVGSDYMTVEEEKELEAERKKSKEKTKFKKKKKSKKKRRRAEIGEDEEEEEDRPNVFSALASGTKSGNTLLSKLEETAKVDESSNFQKRRRNDDMADDEVMQASSDHSLGNRENDLQRQQKIETNRYNYDKIMEKGNERTRDAFATVKVAKEEDFVDDEPDDSFLNAALAKARRLNRLREMNKTSSTGAAAVAEAVKSSSVESENTKESSGVSFSIDNAREFSKAIRARTQQKERVLQKQKVENSPQNDGPVESAEIALETSNTTTNKVVKVEEDVDNDEEMEDLDMEELAKEIKEETLQPGFDGSTGGPLGVGRGLSSFVSMLKTTGEITGKHGGTEELRGRAKDERNYDNLKPMDLSKVVAIGRNATDKDKEFANREIKLDYRDKHGRLLTQKEAYRELCYQFHGHGASKKKEEKRLRQIQREQAEARMASGQVSAARDGTTVGTLGALRATQKATGKAFVVHKT